MSVFWFAVLCLELVCIALAMIWWRGRSKVH